MQLVRWIRDGKPRIMTADHAAHVIEMTSGRLPNPSAPPQDRGGR